MMSGMNEGAQPIPPPSTTAPPARKRRWFQFRMRTLLLVATVLPAACGYLAKEAESVRLRRSFIAGHPGYRYSPFFFRQTPSLVRGFLGDEALNVVALPIDATKQERASASTIFPEAKIFAINTRGYIFNRNRNALPVEFIPFPDESQ
jgi:hypothetical protein